MKKAAEGVMIIHGSKMESHQHAATSKSRNRSKRPSKQISKDLDKLRVFNDRLVSLRHVQTAFSVSLYPLSLGRVNRVEAVQTK